MKFLLIIVLAFALLGPSTVFAQSQGMAVTATADQGSKIISVTGQTVSDITDVTFRVTSPSGNNVVAVAQVTPDSGGEFETMIEVGATWTEDGFYTIEAMQGTQNSLYVLELLVEITNGTTEETSVTEFRSARLEIKFIAQVAGPIPFECEHSLTHDSSSHTFDGNERSELKYISL